MSTTQRQIVWSVGFSFLIAIIVGAIFIYVFPLNSWSEFWNQHFMDIPFVIFIPAFSIAIGILFGAVSGLFWRKQLLRLNTPCIYWRKENKQRLRKNLPISEMHNIANRIEKIGKQMSEQAKLSQRLATEKVEDLEGRIQEIIEQERNRLASELHDSVSQQLFAASMMMSAINETKQNQIENDAKQNN